MTTLVETYSSSTYLKEVYDYIFTFFYEENSEYCITLKEIKKIKKPFKIRERNNLITVLDNGYFILEFIPLEKKHICRVHLDSKLNLIEHFFIITNGNFLINGLPGYYDLKLSLVKFENDLNRYNENIFHEMYETNILDEDAYLTSLSEINNIEKEIYSNSNYIVNLNLKQFLKDRGIICK